MLTQRTFWTTVGLAVLATGVISYELIKFVERRSAPQDIATIAPRPNRPPLPTESVRTIEPPDISTTSVRHSQRVTTEVGLQLNYALKALRQSPAEYERARASMANAERVADKSDFDLFKIHEVWAYLYGTQKQYAGILLHYEAMLTRPELRQFLAPEQSANMTKAVAQYAIALSEYPKSIEYGERWLFDHRNDAEMLALVGQSYYVAKDYQRCKDRMGAAITTNMAAGAKPRETWFRFQISCADSLMDASTSRAALDALCRYFPKPEYWQRYIQNGARNERSDVTIYYWNLLKMDAATELQDPLEQYAFAHQAFVDFNQPVAAREALTKLLSKPSASGRQLPVQRLQSALTAATNRARENDERIDQLAREAAADSSGQKHFELGKIYFDKGQYPLAIVSLENALAAGQISDATYARMSLAIAQLRTGDSDGARANFALAAADPATKAVATAWTTRTYN
jgi:hypothetical protein